MNIIITNELYKIIIISTIIFHIGLYGIINNFKYILFIMFSIEVIYVSWILILGTIIVLTTAYITIFYTILTVIIATVESSIGLSVLINLYNLKKDLNLKNYRVLR